MRKPVLGRGLGRLMQTPEATSSPEQPETLAPGLKILIRGAEGVPATETAAQQQPAPQAAAVAPENLESVEASNVPAAATPQSSDAAPLQTSATETAETLPAVDTAIDRWRPLCGAALLVADVGLIAWPALWVFQQNGPIGWPGIVGCSASVLAGSALGVLAMRLLVR